MIHYSDFFKYHCFNDCIQTGCPGHEVRLVYHNTSDTMNFEENGKATHWVDRNEFRAMIRAYENLKEKSRK